MPSKISYFNKGIFKNNLKRFWLITFSYTFLLFLFTAGYLNSEITRYENADRLETMLNIGRNIFSQSSEPMLLLLGFYPLVAALAVFSYLHFTKSTAMIHSLPVRREALFVTNYLSGLLIVSIPLLFNSAILIITEAVMSFPDMSHAWIWLGINMALTFLLYSFAVFAGMFTGHMAAHAIFFYIYNFLAIFSEVMIGYVLNHLLFGYSGNTGSASLHLGAWSPLYYLNRLYSCFAAGSGNAVVLAGYIIAGIVFLVSGYFLYRRRPMESATDVISFKTVKPVFKYIVAFCSSLILGGIMAGILNIRHSLAGYIVTYLIGGFIGYFASEMLLRKTFRVFRAYKGFIVFGVVLSLLLAGTSLDFFGYERYVPQDQDVELVYVSTYDDSIARLALRPEDYDPDQYGYLFNSTKRYYDGSGAGSPQVLTPAQIDELRKNAGVAESREAITSTRRIHDYIVKNEAVFKENEKDFYSRYEAGERSADFQNRSLYIAYRLNNGTIVERNYSLMLLDSTELDQLLRDYLSLPEIRQMYKPVLNKTAGDIRSVMVYFTTEDGQYNSVEITDTEDFLNAYQKDVQALDPLEYMFPAAETSKFRIEVSIEYKEQGSVEDSPLSSGKFSNNLYSNGLYPRFENTLEFLVQNGIIDPDNLQAEETDTKD